MSNDPVRIFDRSTLDGFRTRALLRSEGSVQITITWSDGTTAFDVLSREERIELARALLADIEPTPVYAVCEYDNCDGDHDGNNVIELYSTKQTADQHHSRGGALGYVRKLDVRTKLREY